MDAIGSLGAAAVLLIALAAVWRRRRRSPRGGPLTDEMIADIETRGRLEVEEPLDLDEAAAEEERFWNEEPWDEPEEL